MALFLAVPAVAQAQSAPISSPEPQVWQTNGTVNAIAVAPDGTTYIGGSFSYVGPQTGCGVALDATSGAVQTAFPEVQGFVYAMVPDGSGGFYIGGWFTSVGGVACSNIAHILADGSLDTTFDTNASANYYVLALAVSGSTVYVGGAFNKIGGQSRSYLAALDAASGDADTTFNANAESDVKALAVSGSTLYAGGDFTSIGGQSRSYIAALDATSGDADTAFNAEANKFSTVFALAVSGSTLYAGGDFTSIGGQSRSYIAALDATTGAATSWNPDANSDVFALAVSGSTLYAGGDFTTVGGQSRNNLAALDATTGATTTWNPDANSTVNALAVSGSTLYAGGDFTSIGGQSRSCIAALDTTSGDATAWDPGANDRVLALAVSGSTVYAGGQFSSAGGGTRNNLAALDATTGAATTWNPDANSTVNALAVSGSTVYAGGDFTSIGGQSRSYIAALDAASGDADTTFNANANSYVDALAVSGSTLYAGGKEYQAGGVDRCYFAALDATSGAAKTWSPVVEDLVEAPVIDALAVSGSTVYAGGVFDYVGGGQSRSCIAAFDATTGAATSWDPEANGEVRALAVSGSTVYAGGDFTSIGGQGRGYIAALDAASGDADTAFNANADGDVNALAVSGSTLYAGGDFSQIGGQSSRNYLAALDASSGDATAWDPEPSLDVDALAVSGATVYAGGNFFSVGESGYDNFCGLACFSPTPALSNLTVSAGGLNPAFVTDTLSYTDIVANSVGAITVTPTTNDSHAGYALQVGGATVINPIALSVGANTIDVVVSGQNGPSQTYLLTVTRAAPPIVATTTTTLTSSLNPSTYGQSVTFTATVNGTAATGSVEFYDGTLDLGPGSFVAPDSWAFSTSALTASLSPHSITAVYSGDASNHGSVSLPLGLSVNPATLTVTPYAQSLTYGDPVPSYTCKVLGFVNGETAATAAGYTAPSCTSAYTPTTAVSASPLTISASGGSANNYVFNTTATANLTIGRATLTVTPDAQSLTYGDPVPSWTYKVTGFVNGETAATAANYVAPTCSCPYTPETPVSASPLTISVSGGSAANYSFTYNTAALTILATSNGGPTWSAQSSGSQYPLMGVSFVDATHGWAVGADGTILATSDGGATWSAQSSGTTNGLTSVSFVDASDGWAVGWDGTILATSDGGASWSAQSSGIFADLYGVSFADASRGWAVGDLGIIRATSNGGASWSARSSGTTNVLYGVSFADAAHGWAVGADGTIVATNSYGSNWSFQSSGTTNGLASVSFVNASDGWAVGADGTILATSDGGASWSAQSSGTTNDLTSVHFIDASDGWAVGADGTILATSDGGASWSAQSSGTTNVLYGVSFVDATHGWAVGWGGTILSLSASGASSTTTKLSSSLNPSTYGQDVTFTATVSPATATGTITFKDGTSSLGSVTLSGGSCSLSTSALFAGTHAITAVYGGDANDTTSTSAVLSQVVSPAALTISAVTDGKTYDGTTSSLVTPQVSGLQGSDTVTGLTQAFTSADAMGNDDSTLQVNTSYTINDGDLGNNYLVTVKPASGTISPVTLTVTPDAQNLTYGDAVPTYTDKVTGFVNGEDATTASGYQAPSCTSTYTQGTSVSASPLTITASGGKADNYSFDTSATANLTIGKATLTVSANNATKTYGAADPAFTYTLSGFTNNDSASTVSVSGTPTISRAAGQNVGGYPINVTSVNGMSASNYSFTASSTPATFTINPATLTVSANNATKTYGAADPAFTYTLSGFTNNDSASTVSVSGTPTISRAAGQNVGGYPINVTSVNGMSASNYSFTASSTPATFTINPATLTVSANNATKTYGAADPAFTYTLSGFTNNDSASTVSVSGTPTISRAAGQNVGGYPINVTSVNGMSASNYSFTASSTPATFTINPATLTVSANNATKTYGAADPAFTYTLSGFTNNDSASTVSVSGTPTISRAAGQNVGSYAINVSDTGTLSAANYSFTPASTPATLTVNPAALTVTANNVSRSYGDPNPTPAFTVSGFVGSDTWTTAPTGVIATPDGNVGSYAITFSGGNAGGNYTVSYVPGTLTVKPRPITVIAVASSKTYDGTVSSAGVPQITSGTLASGDTASWSQSFASKDVGTNISLIPTGTVSDQNGGKNYAVTFVNGTAGVIKAAPLTATPVSQSLSFGAPVPSYSCTITGFVNKETATSAVGYHAPTCSCTYTPTTPVSASPLTITCSGGSATDYSFSYQTGTLTITKAPTTVVLTVTAAQYSDVSTFTATVSPATAGGSQLSGTVQFAVNGSNVGKAVATNSSGVASYNYTVTSPQGSYPVTATFTSSNANFASPAAATTQNLVVSPEDASIAYTGDTLGTVGSALNLQATVMDSAAAGYSGLNPETGATKTIGDITKMWIAFVITPVGGTTSTTVYAQVLDTGTVGDGIGTASTTYKAASTGSYTVLCQLVAGATGGTNQYYTAPDALPASITFAPSSGEFATGGGWITDPATSSRGFFGLDAFYGSAGKAQGQLAYVWSGSYNGVPAFFTITSNTITALSFSGSTYPLSATLSGTATLQVNKASNFALLYGPETKLPFTVSAYDTGKSSGVGLDKLSLTLTGSKASFLTGGMKSFSGVLLGGGNIVIRLK